MYDFFVYLLIPVLIATLLLLLILLVFKKLIKRYGRK